MKDLIITLIGRRESPIEKIMKYIEYATTVVVFVKAGIELKASLENNKVCQE